MLLNVKSQTNIYDYNVFYILKGLFIVQRCILVDNLMFFLDDYYIQWMMIIRLVSWMDKMLTLLPSRQQIITFQTGAPLSTCQYFGCWKPACIVLRYIICSESLKYNTELWFSALQSTLDFLLLFHGHERVYYDEDFNSFEKAASFICCYVCSLCNVLQITFDGKFHYFFNEVLRTCH